MPKRVRRWIKFLQAHANAWWYAPAIGLLAALDAFVVVIPTDGLLAGASLLSPRRWIYTTLVVTLGSTIGAWCLAALLEVHGLPLLLYLKPGLDQTEIWRWTDGVMDQWGGLTLFLIALSPIMQHPAVALSAFAGMPLWDIFLLVFAGRLIKYAFISWVSTHAPNLLGKLWGMKNEIEEAGVDEIKSPPARGPEADSP